MNRHHNILQARMVDGEPVDLYIQLLENKPGCAGFYLQHPEPSVLIANMEQCFPVVNAAGGLVLSPNGKLLMIFRKGFWDLPKGKPEGDETTEETAVREVIEECGIPNPSLNVEFFTTRHFYREHEQGFIKKTLWYLMEVDTNDLPLVPQTKEDITHAIWCSKEEYLKIRNQCFPSVRELIERLWIID